MPLFNGHLSRLANGYLSIPNANKIFPQGPVEQGLMDSVYKGLFLIIVKAIKIVAPSEKKVSYIRGDIFLYLLFTVSGFVNKQLRKV